MPFHFWSVVFFVFGCIVGSFLNVCIHRMPLGQSIVSPPSHCPHCKYSIPWYLNMPLADLAVSARQMPELRRADLRPLFPGRAAHGRDVLGCWLAFGPHSVLLALVYCVFLAGLIAATFIDFEHFIIPDEITYRRDGRGICVLVFAAAIARASRRHRRA